MPINSAGIYEYDDTEDFAPLHAYQRLLTDSVTATVGDLRAAIAAVDALVDSSWVEITTFSPLWTPQPNYAPRVRKIGARVDIMGSVVAAASSNPDSILTIPVGFRPSGAYPNQWLGHFRATSGMSGMFHLSSSAGANQFKLGAPAAYRTGTIGAGSFLPLVGSWYVD